MNLTIVFFLGFFIAFVGVIPPGLLNISATKISLKEGHGSAVVFSTGVCLTIALQTFFAITFASYLKNHPDVVDILQRVAMVVFALISIYYLFVLKNAKPNTPKINIKSKRNRFFYGMGLSALNLFPIPYQAYMGMTLFSLKLLSFEQSLIFSYVAGAVMGTFAMLYTYVFFFHKSQKHYLISPKNMNRSIGLITGVIALITLINIWREA